MTSIVTWQRYMFMLMVLCLPFTHFSLDFPLVGKSPYLFFLLIGYVLFLFECIILRTSFNKWEECECVFLCIIIMWKAITGIIGIVDYQYFEQINLGQMENFKNLFDNLSFYFPLNEESSIKCWLIYKEIRGAILDVAYSYLISFWIYHIYKENWKKAIYDLKKITLILCAILSFYSIFEINYLMGGDIGKIFLSTVNPIYMTIADTHDWWPPLFWNGQLRSLFAEPSFFGIYTSMAIPVLFSFYLDNKFTYKSLIGRIIYIFIVIMLVLSKARTATVLFCIEFFLLIVWMYIYGRQYWKKFVLLGGGTCIAFFIGLGIMTQFQPQNNQYQDNVSVESYVSQNIASVVGNKRSNSARYANVQATVLVGIQHPIFGVGYGLKDMYLDKNLQDDDRLVPEVANWSRIMYEKGPLKSSYPTLNQIAGVFAEEGLIGVLLFMTPILGIIIGVIKYRINSFDSERICLIISFIGLCCAFFSNIATVEFFIITGFMILLFEHYREFNDE